MKLEIMIIDENRFMRSELLFQKFNIGEMITWIRIFLGKAKREHLIYRGLR